MRMRLLGATVAVAVLAPSLAVAGPAAAAPSSRARTTVVLSALPSSADVGRKVRLTGRVTPAKKARKVAVTVQRRYAGGRWRTVEKTRTTKTGRYTTRVRLTRPGATSFRVRVAGRASRPRSVSVYTWLRAVDVPSLVSGTAGVEQRRTVRIGGRAFPGSIVFPGGAGTLVLKSAGRCSTFEAVTGFLDTDRPGLPSTAQQNGSYQTGSGAEGSFSTPLGPARRVRLGIAGRPYLLLSMTVANASGKRAVLGSPRIRCTTSTLPELTVEEIGG